MPFWSATLQTNYLHKRAKTPTTYNIYCIEAAHLGLFWPPIKKCCLLSSCLMLCGSFHFCKRTETRQFSEGTTKTGVLSLTWGKGSCPLWHHKGKNSDWVSFGTHFEMGDESKGWTSSNLWKVHWRLEKECRQIWNTGCNLTLLILCVPSVPHPAERANPCTSTQRGRSVSAAFLQRPQVLIAFRAPRVGSDQPDQLDCWCRKKPGFTRRPVSHTSFLFIFRRKRNCYSQ